VVIKLITSELEDLEMSFLGYLAIPTHFSSMVSFVPPISNDAASKGSWSLGGGSKYTCAAKAAPAKGAHPQTVQFVAK